MELIRNEAVCGFLKAWYEFVKEVLVAYLRHGVISKGNGCGLLEARRYFERKWLWPN